MAMSRKDYVAIADALNSHFRTHDDPTSTANQSLTSDIMDAIYRAGNTNLDRPRFISATFKGL